MTAPAQRTKKAPDTVAAVIEGQSRSRCSGSPNHVHILSKEQNLSMIEYTDATVNAVITLDDIPKPPEPCTVPWCDRAESCKWEPDRGHGWTRQHETRINDAVAVFTVEYQYGTDIDGLQDMVVDVIYDAIASPDDIERITDALHQAKAIIAPAPAPAPAPALEWVETQHDVGTADEYWEREAKVGELAGGEWTCEHSAGDIEPTTVSIQTQGSVLRNGVDLMDDGICIRLQPDCFGLHYVTADSARQLAALLAQAADLLEVMGAGAGEATR